MLVAVAGCVAQAEGEEIIRRQPAVDLVVGPQSYHRLPELIARAHRASRRGAGGRLRRRRRSSTPCRPSARRTGVTAFLTVQEGCDKFCSFCVVPYTRGAEYSRARRRPSRPRRGRWRTRACARSPCWARTSTPTPARAAAGGAGPAAGEDPGLDAHPLHHQPSPRHGRRPDRRPRRARRADALSAPAGAGGVRSGAEGDEPRPHRRALSAPGRSASAPRGRTSPCPATSSSAFPARRDADFEATLDLVRQVGYASAFSFKYSRRPGTPGRRHARPGRRRGQGRAAGAAAGAARRAAARLQRRPGRPHRCRCCSNDRPPARPGRRPQPLSAAGAYRGPERLIGTIAPVLITQAARGSLTGRSPRCWRLA